MLVTGSNLKNIKSVSIQVSLNGLSFFNTRGEKISQEIITFDNIEGINEWLKRLRKLSSIITLYIESDNFVLVPNNLYSPDNIELLFSAKSLIFDSEKIQYCHDTTNGISVVYGFDKRLENLLSPFFDNIIAQHMIERVIGSSIKNSSLSFYASVQRCIIAYTKHGKLQFADSLSISNQLDVIYYLQRVISDYGIDENQTLYSLESIDKRVEQQISEQIKNQIRHENS